jgi:DNA-binding MarR family transcriptional regulator
VQHSDGLSDSGAEPRWLTADERAAWLAATALMGLLPAALDARMQRDAGLTFFEYMVLALLSEQPDRTMQMGDLALAASASLSRLSHVVGRLEKQGLVDRARVPGRGRRTNAILTEAGYAKVVAAAPGHVAVVRDLFLDPLTSAEIATLGRAGRKVTARIASRGECPDATG